MVLLQFDLARLLGICELKTIDKKKYHAITMERDHSGKHTLIFDHYLQKRRFENQKQRLNLCIILY